MVSTQSPLQSPDNIMEIHTLINECGNIDFTMQQHQQQQYNFKNDY